MDFGGFWGVLGGYLVAFKQAFPQRRLPFFGLAIVESRVSATAPPTVLGIGAASQLVLPTEGVVRAR